MRPSIELPEYRVAVELAADPQRQCDVLIKILRSGSGCAYFSAVCEYCLKTSTHKVVRRLAYSVLRGCKSYSGDEWVKLAVLVQRDLEGAIAQRSADAEDICVSALQTLDTLYTVPDLAERLPKFSETLAELLSHPSVRIRHASVLSTAAFLLSAKWDDLNGANQHVRYPHLPPSSCEHERRILPQQCLSQEGQNSLPHRPRRFAAPRHTTTKTSILLPTFFLATWRGPPNGRARPRARAHRRRSCANCSTAAPPTTWRRSSTRTRIPARAR